MLRSYRLATERAKPYRVARAWLGVALLGAAAAGCGDGAPPIPDAQKLFIEARDQLAGGDVDAALETLSASIAAEPTEWALFERAKLYAQRGDDAAAQSDVDAALAITPDEPDYQWLQGELEKPLAQRFKGQFESPPSSHR